MIIDAHADFRSLLMHHITTHWPDAVISAYDPTVAGHLPDEFSGAGNDLILLGSAHGESREGEEVPHELKLERDVFGDPGSRLPILRALKERFDPTGTLNPGRAQGFL